jgi:hypothetical protein
MINIDSNDFALLVKNVVPGSRPIQQLGSRDVFFNDIEQLPGGPMPHDGKTYMRCKRSGKKPDVKDVKLAGLADEKDKEESKKQHPIHKWISKQIQVNGWIELFNVVLMLASLIGGVYYGWKTSSGPQGLYLVLMGQKIAAWLRSFFVKTPVAPAFTSAKTV